MAGEEDELRSYSVQFGYGDDFIELNDSPRGRQQVMQIPIGEWDQIVRDYIQTRREKFLAAGLVDGVLFDDHGDTGF